MLKYKDTVWKKKAVLKTCFFSSSSKNLFILITYQRTFDCNASKLVLSFDLTFLSLSMMMLNSTAKISFR